MRVSGYDTSGSIIWTKDVVKITNFAADHGFGRPEYYTLYLSDGHYVDLPNTILDERYPGWRDLLEGEDPDGL